MADGRHIAEYWKRYNSPTNGPIWMKLGWSHPITSPICPQHGGHIGDIYVRHVAVAMATAATAVA